MQVEQLLHVYILSLGIFLVTVAGAEFVAPLTMFQVWRKWIMHRFFFLHGVSLIIMGFPLTQYESLASPIVGKAIFVIGLLVVFTGPFILIYPEKIRRLFAELGETAGENGVRRLIYMDAASRICIGGLFVYSYFA